MNSFETMKKAVEGGQLSEQAQTKKQEIIDIARCFNNVFSTDEGKRVLEHLDKYSHKNFPNHDNVYATYSKVGEQTLVKYIEVMIAYSRKD